MEIWVSIGQSNSMGQGPAVAEFEINGRDKIHPRLYQYSFGIEGLGYRAGSPGELIPAQQALQYPEMPLFIDRVSPFFHFGKQYVKDNAEKRVALLCTGEGAHGFDPTVTSSGTTDGFLAPCWDLTGDTGVISGDIYQRAVRLCNELIPKGHTLGGFIFHAGENEVALYNETDGQPSNTTRMEMFAARLWHLIEALRANIVDDEDGGHLDKPFVITTLIEGWTGRTTTRGNDAQAALASIPAVVPFTTLVNIADLVTMNADDTFWIHFESEEYRRIGRRVAGAVSNARANNAAALLGPECTIEHNGTAVVNVDAGAVYPSSVGSGVTLATDAVYGNVMSFNGVNLQAEILLDHRNIGIDDIIDATGFTIAALFKIASGAGEVQIVSAAPGDGNEFAWLVAAGDMTAGNITGLFADVNAGAVSEDEWHVGIVTYDSTVGANGTYTIDIDGDQKDSSVAAAANSTDFNVMIGDYTQDGVAANFEGEMKRVGIWNRAMSRDERRKLFLDWYRGA